MRNRVEWSRFENRINYALTKFRVTTRDDYGLGLQLAICQEVKPDDDALATVNPIWKGPRVVDLVLDRIYVVLNRLGR